MKVLFTGGGTIGSVSPLLAVLERLTLSPKPFTREISVKGRDKQYEFLWVGTRYGTEKELVASYKIPYKAIFSGKLDRYFSWQNFVSPVFIILGFFQSLSIILKARPQIILSAGSFVSVPIVFVAWILRIPILIHQQDVRPGFANKLMSPFARCITVTFEKSLADFPKGKVVWTGNPMREEVLKGDEKRAKKFFDLQEDLPTLLIFGGGTGALRINELIVKSLPELLKFCQIIHLTGRGRRVNKVNKVEKVIERYHAYEFLTREMADAYAVSDIVVSRCGLSTLTELSLLGKPAILIPIPRSHQEENAKVFAEAWAAVVLDQRNLTSEGLVKQIKSLLENRDKIRELSQNIKRIMKPNATEKIVEEIEKIISDSEIQPPNI